VICPQQILVQRLIGTFLDGGGDLRFESEEVALHDLTGDRPRVTYRDAAGGRHEIECQFVAGCDGDHGVSRTNVPAGALRAYSYDYGIGLLTVLADTPASRYPLFAVSERGFAARFARGPNASRNYLQCPLGEDLANWPDDRFWAVRGGRRLAGRTVPAAAGQGAPEPRVQLTAGGRRVRRPDARRDLTAPLVVPMPPERAGVDRPQDTPPPGALGA
jgi:2-polyprenyl-6-methoxyphenol hydroxylase-like FAD-dependent oxidoreductase